jgi:hypothetical protein
MSVDWLSLMGDKDTAFDRQLAAEFNGLPARTPNSALPTIDPNGNYIQEYDHTFFPTVKGLEAVTVTEDVDLGHRHYSAMHWLYPGYFQPTASNKESTAGLTEAAKNFMIRRANNNGGHTSWSAVWEASLFARLGDSDHAFNSLLRVLSRFSTANMMSLHPNLAGKPAGKRTDGGPQPQLGFLNECDTCFEESPESQNRQAISSSAATPAVMNGRGMTTMMDDKVQTS